MKKDDDSEFKFVGYTLLIIFLIVALVIVLSVRFGKF